MVRLLRRLTTMLRGPDAGAPRIGRYRVLRRLAEGGMGELFLARAVGRSGFERVVVLKKILQHNMANAEAVRMFLDEARLMATLNHPNIVHVYDFGTARGAPFFTMEYVPGEDVGRIMKALAAAGHTLPLEVAIGIIADAAAGLHHAHEMRGPDGTPLQIVHRDISPSNVLVSYDGAVKVADFGIAKWTRRETETRYGAIKGKIAYMSPEQCRAEPLDRRSDVFGLGILLFELTTGTRLYQGTSDFAILQQVVSRDAPRPSSLRHDCPSPVEHIILRALSRDPARRFATARDMQLALEEFAREARLPITAVARAGAMEALFGGKITAWREALQAGLSPAEFLERVGVGQDARAITPLETPGGLALPGRGGTMQEGSAIPLPLPDALGENTLAVTRGPAAARSWLLPAVVVAVVAAGAIFYLRQTPSPLAGSTLPRSAHADLLPNVEPLPSPPRPDESAAPTGASARNEPESRSGRPHRPKGHGAESPVPPGAATKGAPKAGPGKKVWDPDSIYLP